MNTFMDQFAEGNHQDNIIKLIVAWTKAQRQLDDPLTPARTRRAAKETQADAEAVLTSFGYKIWVQDGQIFYSPTVY